MDIRALFYPENEKPLDRLVTDGGFASIFRTIACVGDSLSSGEFETVDSDGTRHYYDMYEHSWGQYIARAAGCKVYNFSRGGMRAKWYCDSFATDRGFWKKELAAQAYIIAMGVNDLMGQHQEPGSIADVDMNDWHNNRDTFIGCYAQIIQRYQAIQPDAKFFLVTIPKSNGEAYCAAAETQRRCIYELANAFDNCYVIDLWQYGPTYDDDFKQKFYLNGHMSPCGYILTAQLIMSYMDYIIRHNPEEFKYVGFIGKSIL